MKRREFISLVGGAAAAWPATALAQRSDQRRRIGILHDYAEADPEGRAQIAALREELAKLGWIEGRNLAIDFRAGAEEADALRGLVKDLLAKSPDILVGAGGTIVATLQRATKSVPIVFANVTDPVGGGLVASLARPGGNATGFTQFEFGISAKWLELLKDMAPATTLVAVIRDPSARSGGGQLGAIQAVAPSLRVDVKPVDAGDREEIERKLLDFSRDGKAGLIVTSSRLARAHRELIVNLAAHNRLPAIYAFRVFVADGGLMSYGPDATTPYRRAAGYIDRIFRGERPADLPVQAPTKYELTINLKAAKTIGLDVPPMLLARADEVIE
jgi:putative ABC transport system substrate-binding protein